MKKIVTIVGNRPQFIKSSIVSEVFRKSKIIEEIIIHSGQHYSSNMSDLFFRELSLDAPKYFLNINNTTHGQMIGSMIKKIEIILLKIKPKLVIVYGDTNTTLAGAISAAKCNIPVAHIESGLRSYNITMPEEVNRKLTDHLSSILFVPTITAKVTTTNYNCNHRCRGLI